MYKNLFLFLLLPLLLGGCGYHKIFLTPEKVSKLNENIFYEDGALEKAKHISSFLQAEISDVETKQYKPFARPVQIYVFANQDTYAKYAVIPQSGGETQGSARILISPKKENTVERLPGLVHHELSHLHLFGHTGIYKGMKIPSWFIEGLAVWVSDGGGAEGVGENEAKISIKNESQVNPIRSKTFLLFDDSKPKDMSQHMFYKQSGMFVAYLHSVSPEKFGYLIAEIESGKDFDDSFSEAYEAEPYILWKQFVSTISIVENRK